MRSDGQVACDLFSFVDDERITGPDEELTWQASHTMAAKQSYLGVQDAGRKARPSSKQPGAWAGAIVHVVASLGVSVLTSVEKWAKMRAILDKWWVILLAEKKPKLPHKELLSDQRFLVYVTRTYPAMVPYLKGFHLTIEMWRGGQNAEGWKRKSTNDEDNDASIDSLMLLTSLDETRAGGHCLDLSVTALYSLNHSEDEDVSRINHRMDLKGGNGHRYTPDDRVTISVPQFKDDIRALMRLTDFKLLPL